MVVTDRGSLRTVTVVEMYSLIFEKLGRLCYESLGASAEEYDLRKAVITVANDFDDKQKTAMREAADMAGLNIINMISEKEAIKAAYGMNDEKGVNLLIDFGGSELKIMVGDQSHKETLLSGSELDIVFTNSCVASFKRTTAIDIGRKPKQVRRLRNACEKAKIRLSNKQRVTIRCAALDEGEDYVETFTR